MSAKLKSADFIPHVHTEFRLRNQKLQRAAIAELLAVEYRISR